MTLIDIGNNVMVNPDKIDAVELITRKDGQFGEIIVYVNNRRFNATKNIERFLREINRTDLSKQFFAG